MTRFKTYQMDYGFITIDTQTEQPPEDYIDVFDTTVAEADTIQNGAIIEVEGNGLVITPDEHEPWDGGV